MALNVPVTMLMSMVVAFTITPWLAYHVLRRKYSTRRRGRATRNTIWTIWRRSSSRGSTRCSTR